ncbi:MAG TPA: hypothetical protein VII60_04005 [Acidimicrobiales bacterium]
MSKTTPRLRVENRITVVLVLVVVAALTFALLVLTNHSGPPTSTTKAGFKCAPYTAFPTLKLGHHASVSAAFDGFRATFSATATKKNTIRFQPSGMPFTGDLKVAEGTRTWTLPKPSVSKDYQINDLCLISFAKGHSPAVLTEGYTGGAHCCELPVLYSLQPSSDRFVQVLDMTPTNFKYSLAFDNNGGFRPMLVGSHVLLRTEDDQFAYTFGCYACTPMPIVLDAFDGTHLTDVTGQHPSLIRPEAASLLKQATLDAKGEHSPAWSGIGPFGSLAAWVADECALNQGAQAWSRVLSFQGVGELSNKVYYADTLIKGSYVAQLRRFLLKGEYCTGQFGE